MALGLKIHEAMNPNPQTVSETTTVDKALKFMLRTGVGSLIVTGKKKPIGLLTEKDLLLKVMSRNKDPRQLKVKDIMTKKIISVSPHDDLEVAAKLMAKKSLRRLPVLEGRKLVGMLTVKDLLNLAPSLIDILKQRLEMANSSVSAGRKVVVPGICDSCNGHSDALKRVNGEFLCSECEE